ncbi:MAG: ArnT family glycosyltransferase [Solirubrobacterales bacterium]
MEPTTIERPQLDERSPLDQATSEQPPPRTEARRGVRRFRPEFFGLLLMTAALNLINLGQNGWANNYYAATVKSMTVSWHNFIFNSFDPAGVMTVDKPPLAMWVQAASAEVFGFNSWAILVPQALMGVAAVALLYDLTRRVWSRWPALVAGAVLALTPMTVAISRHNNPDALLVLCCVAAAWFVVRALQDGRTRWLLLAGAMIGLGFETKMGAALLVLPATAAAYLYIAPRGYLKSFGQLLAGGGVAAVTGLAWPLLMWLTPAADRPWISGTADNSIWSLIMNYNGLGRLDGQAGGPAGAAGGGPGGGNGPGGGGGFFGGSTGVGRLFNDALGGQAGWLLGFAVVSAIAVIVATRMRRNDLRTGWLIAIGGSFATIAIAFSFAKGIFHPYYVSQLAPFTAGLVGGGFGVMQSRKDDERAPISMRWFAVAAIGAGVIAEIAIAGNYSGQSWVTVLMLAVAAPAAIAVATASERKWRNAALAVALGALLVAPAIWSVQTLGYATSSTFPSGGPQSATSGMGGPGGARMGRGMPQGGQMPQQVQPQTTQPVQPQTPAPNSGTTNSSGLQTSTTAFNPGQQGFGGPPPGMNGPPPGMNGGRMTPPGTQGGSRGGGMFGGQDLTAITTYTEAHGGGTIGVSSQSGASSAIIGGKNVAGIGGFSGRESEVSVDWLADRIEAGGIRWIYTGGQMGGMQDNRVGSKSVMSAVANACAPVSASALGSSATTSSSSSNLYDCAGKANALRAAAQ